MKKVMKIVACALLCTAAMGLASRDWRPPALADEELTVYDVHLKYYEQIRPALVGTDSTLTALCGGGRAEAHQVE